MNKHQELRDAIRNLMKATDHRIGNIKRKGELISSHESGLISEMEHQNDMLQCILIAHK